MLEIEVQNTLIPVKVDGKIIFTEMHYFCVYFSQTGDYFNASLSLANLSQNWGSIDDVSCRYVGNARYESSWLKRGAKHLDYYLPNGELINSNWYYLCYNEGHFVVSLKDMRNDYLLEPTADELAFIKRVLNTDDENACQLFDLDRLISELLTIVETQLIEPIDG